MSYWLDSPSLAFFLDWQLSEFTGRSIKRGLIDANVGTAVVSHTDTPNWLGLNGEVGYLGLRIELGGATPSHYGWVGVRVTNEDDATGEVVGFGYNDVPGAPIPAGQIPEPGTMALAALGGITLAGSWITRTFRK